MKYVLFVLVMICMGWSQEFYSDISPITTTIKKRMISGNSWKKGCPVALSELRYLRVTYINFKGQSQIGELIIHQDVAEGVSHIFEELYNIGYPINQMKLVSDFKGNDWQSIEADNTSALNCRPITGNSKKWSNHAYGKAIDINPIENPYISRKGYISHRASIKYKKRIHVTPEKFEDTAILLKNDKVVNIFKKYGWSWGGEWGPIKDYQHFEYIEK